MKPQTIIAAIISILILVAAFLIAAQNFGLFGIVEDGSSGPTADTDDVTSNYDRSDSTETEGTIESGADDPSTSGYAAVVRTVVAIEQELQGQVRLNGEIQAEETAVVYPDIAGTLSRVLAMPGQYVRENQPIASVDPSRPGAEYQQSPVESPLAGYVTAIHLDRGTTVSTNSGIATVATLDRLEIVVEVPERYATAVKPNMSATFNTFALKDRIFEARVVEIQPVLDPLTRSKEVRLRVVGNTEELQPGMFTRVSLPVRNSGRVVTVPFSALVQEAGNTYVYVVVDGRTIRRAVRIGLIANDYVEIADGLESGDVVVSDGVQKVQDNAAVRIANATGEDL